MARQTGSSQPFLFINISGNLQKEKPTKPLNTFEQLLVDAKDIGMKTSVALVLCLTLCIQQVIGVQTHDTKCCSIKQRRYDIIDVGYQKYFHGWVDVQGQGAANDYCRLVGNSPDIWLSCALAGQHGESEYVHNSVKKGFEIGFDNTWYMKDEDGDGKDDYCRCLSVQERDNTTVTKVMCTKAGKHGFYGSFSPTGPIDCRHRPIRPEFGRNWGV